MPSAAWDPLPLPRQHGAWVMLSLPLLFGLAMTGPTSGAAWMIVPSVLLSFLAHDALVPAMQRVRSDKASPPGYVRRRAAWGSLYVAAAAACFTAAVLLTEPAARRALATVAILAGIAAAIYGGAAVLGEGRALWSELVGMAGMSLAAPMMAAAAGQGVVGRPLGAAAMAFAYCVSSVSFVRAYDRLPSARLSAVAACVLAHGVLLAGVVAVILADWLPAWGLVAFVPVVARTAWGLARPPENLKRLGMRELWVATTFAALAMASLAA